MTGVLCVRLHSYSMVSTVILQNMLSLHYTVQQHTYRTAYLVCTFIYKYIIRWYIFCKYFHNMLTKTMLIWLQRSCGIKNWSLYAPLVYIYIYIYKTMTKNWQWRWLMINVLICSTRTLEFPDDCTLVPKHVGVNVCHLCCITKCICWIMYWI